MTNFIIAVLQAVTFHLISQQLQLESERQLLFATSCIDKQQTV